MKFELSRSLLYIILFLGAGTVLGQTTIKGVILDQASGDPLIGANVVVKGTGTGTISDEDGSFTFKTDLPLPVTLMITYLGYTDQEISVKDPREKLVVEMGENSQTLSTVEVTGRRISEKQQQSALTMETLDNIGIKETPAANFYDGLGSLKDVDLTAASLGFKIINTRGFNSTSPVRSLQIIDGVDNQSPGLNFSLGNFLGASELDVNRVNLIVGASSAFYGPNAFNGVIAMETKNPFLHKGLSAQIKVGERNLLETGFRWADAIKNKAGNDFFAYKLNFFYFKADDWVADNYDAVYESPSLAINPGGYDAVNIYGDEYQTPNDLDGNLSFPGLGVIHRRGYEEKDLVDYDSENLKAGAAFHFRLNPSKTVASPELILSSNFSTGTTVYQGDNRFSLRDIRFFQHRVELNKLDKYFLRAYVTHEDAGNSYDPYFTALLLQSNAKENGQWLVDYLNYWSRNATPLIRGQEGYPKPSDYIGRPADFRTAINSFLARPDIQKLLEDQHALGQKAANTGSPLSESKDFFEPGTEAFQREFERITSSLSYSEGGTRFYDRSALAHVHGEYMFNDLVEGSVVSDLDLRIGANFRQYMPNSKGSILLDTMGRNIDTYEYGVYGGGTMELGSRLKVSGSLRMDKNQNFDYLFSPAASLVYTPDINNTVRASFSSAIRNPTLADQYLFYNVGRAILLGNLDGFQNLITVESLVDYLTTLDANTLERFDVAPVRPEKVRTLEAGYRTTLWSKLYLDMTYYYSFYRDFIGFNFGVDADFNSLTRFPENVQAYRIAANATDRVTTQGYSVGFSYYVWKKYVLNGNYSWNKLNTATDDPIIPAFNTPENKFNVGFSGRDVTLKLGSKSIRNLGFNVNYKWIDEFIFEGSPQFTGVIPQYDLLDAQINWEATKINTTFKLGASNVLNRQTFQTYGGPRIGRLVYASATYDFKKQ